MIETLRDLPLASANIPALAILTAIGPEGNKTYFELTGDAALLLEKPTVSPSG
jgi:hypothetical protein